MVYSRKAIKNRNQNWAHFSNKHRDRDSKPNKSSLIARKSIIYQHKQGIIIVKLLERSKAQQLKNQLRQKFIKPAEVNKKIPSCLFTSQFRTIILLSLFFPFEESGGGINNARNWTGTQKTHSNHQHDDRERSWDII